MMKLIKQANITNTNIFKTKCKNQRKLMTKFNVPYRGAQGLMDLPLYNEGVIDYRTNAVPRLYKKIIVAVVFPVSCDIVKFRWADRVGSLIPPVL